VSERIVLEMSRLNRDISVHIPKERIFSAKNGKKVFKDKALYPGYIFVETENIGDLSSIVRETTGASNILKGKDGNFVTLRKTEVSKMMNQKEELEAPVSDELYVIGETIKVIDGPFMDFNAKIESIDIDRKKVKVLVSIFKKLTPVDLDFDQVTKI
jgi:transcriptional antiterminator NusG